MSSDDVFCLQLVRLQEENDSLVNKHSKNAQQMQNEDINLPNNLEVPETMSLTFFILHLVQYMRI